MHLMPEFLQLSLVDILDIVLVGLLIYQVYKLIKGTSAVNIFVAIILIYIVWLVVKALHMELLTTILDKVINVSVLALIIVFHPEIRRFLVKLGTRFKEGNRYHVLGSLFRRQASGISKQVMEEVTHACSRMAERRAGALIALERSASLDYVAETGDRIDATVNRRLIENIFFKNSPLHDGGMLIANGRILAARCTFPMSESQLIPPQFGMRHRAAVGLSEQTDAFIITISEETGNISIMRDGEIKTLSGVAELRAEMDLAFQE